MRLRTAGPDLAEVLSTIHAATIDDPWSADDMRVLLSGPGVLGLLAESEGQPLAFVLVRLVADEGEILTLATLPSQRRQGLARTLLEAAAGAARSKSVQSLFLEVAEDNPGALALYERFGFRDVGRRHGYYARRGRAADALILRLDL